MRDNGCSPLRSARLPARRSEGQRRHLARKWHEAQVKYHEPGAPDRIRTRDPLLRRHLSGVAGRRLESFYVAISCIDRGWAWLDVALRLSQLAPFLAPPI